MSSSLSVAEFYGYSYVRNISTYLYTVCTVCQHMQSVHICVHLPVYRVLSTDHKPWVYEAGAKGCSPPSPHSNNIHAISGKHALNFLVKEVQIPQSEVAPNAPGRIASIYLLRTDTPFEEARGKSIYLLAPSRHSSHQVHVI